MHLCKKCKNEGQLFQQFHIVHLLKITIIFIQHSLVEQYFNYIMFT